jgi:hypothetical protein
VKLRWRKPKAFRHELEHCEGKLLGFGYIVLASLSTSSQKMQVIELSDLTSAAQTFF